MKNIALGLFCIISGGFMVSASFVDYGLPNAGPGAPGQTASSVFGAFMILAGVGCLVQHFKDAGDDA